MIIVEPLNRQFNEFVRYIARKFAILSDVSSY